MPIGTGQLAFWLRIIERQTAHPCSTIRVAGTKERCAMMLSGQSASLLAPLTARSMNRTKEALLIRIISQCNQLPATNTKKCSAREMLQMLSHA
jgi:hypothetical protein